MKHTEVCKLAKHKYITKKLLLVIGVTFLTLLCGCKANPSRKDETNMPKPEITSLSLAYSGGVELAGNYSYLVSKDNDKYHLQASLNSGNLEIEKEITQWEYEAFVQLFDNVDLTSCSNSNNDDREIALDAASFTFTASFGDGTVCKAHSLSRAPEGYSQAVEAFESLFKQMIKEVESTDN